MTCGTPSERYSANALVGMLQEVRPAGRRGRRHRRRQVDDPPRVHREAAHHLQRSCRVLLADRHRARQPRLDDPLAGDVVDVEQQGWPGLVFAGGDLIRREERLGRLVVDALGRDGHELPLGPAQCRELAAEHAARVDVDRVVQPLRIGYRGVAVDDDRAPAIVGRPLTADGQTELVCLACCFSVEREVSDPRGGAALVGLLHPGVRHNERPVIEDRRG